jgi:hypothetical protein
MTYPGCNATVVIQSCWLKCMALYVRFSIKLQPQIMEVCLLCEPIQRRLRRAICRGDERAHGPHSSDRASNCRYSSELRILGLLEQRSERLEQQQWTNSVGLEAVKHILGLDQLDRHHGRAASGIGDDNVNVINPSGLDVAQSFFGVVGGGALNVHENKFGVIAS